MDSIYNFFILAHSGGFNMCCLFMPGQTQSWRYKTHGFIFFDMVISYVCRTVWHFALQLTVWMLRHGCTHQEDRVRTGLPYSRSPYMTMHGLFATQGSFTDVHRVVCSIDLIQCHLLRQPCHRSFSSPSVKITTSSVDDERCFAVEQGFVRRIRSWSFTQFTVISYLNSCT